MSTKTIQFILFSTIIFNLTVIPSCWGAMTRKQLQQSMDMMRSACAPKFPKLTTEILDGLKSGQWDDSNKDLKCYTLCVAQMAGTMTKKNEISYQKTATQIDLMLPADLKEFALKALDLCKDVQKDHKDPCDKTFFASKCAYEAYPEYFIFP